MGGRLAICATAFLTGGGTLVLELTSVRALAPHFGASTEVWTGAIGIVLLALACGYAVGGTIAERGNVLRSLGLALCASGLLVAATPWLLRPIADWMLPPDLSLGDASVILRTAALVTEALLFGLPVFLLGFTNPCLVKALSLRDVAAGRATGLVLAASTLGGLLGTFGTTYWLVPEIGVRTTLFATGVALGCTGTIALAGVRRPVRAGLLVLIAGGLGHFGLEHVASGPERRLRVDESLLHEEHGREQFLRVVERTGPFGLERWLQVNECLDSFQSLDVPARPTPGHYYDVLAVAPILARWRSGGWIGEGDARVLSIGAGAGSVVRSLLAFGPGTRVDGVELDPRVLDLGRRFFRLDELESMSDSAGVPLVRSIGGLDGRAALRALPGPYDAILIDAYARQVEIPFHLVTREMFEICAERLAPGGVLAINVSSFGVDDPVLRAVAATLARALPPADGRSASVLVLGVWFDHNYVLVARKGAQLPRMDRFLAEVRQQSAPGVTSVAQALAGPGGSFEFTPDPDDPILVDDRAPMERLQALSLGRARAAMR